MILDVKTLDDDDDDDDDVPADLVIAWYFNPIRPHFNKHNFTEVCKTRVYIEILLQSFKKINAPI